jgi:predicted ATP-binding protein involved in virulence
MRLTSVTVENYPPIGHFSVTDLTDVVVLAGPNGVGKSRILQAVMDCLRSSAPNVKLALEATCPEEEKAWERNAVATTDPQARERLQHYLRRQQKRGAVRSSILNFDANRVFERVNPLQPSWDYSNPFDEWMDWGFTFNIAKQRFDDVINSMLRRVRSLKDEIASRAMQLQAGGQKDMPLDFEDPLSAFKTAFRQLLPGKSLAPIDERTQTLQYRLDDSTDNLPLDSLSSGEREVVTIVFDFLLRDPQDSIIIIDEPELHLHPELSYRLIRTLRGVGQRNQFILSTHSPDIISASLDNSVIFVSPSRLESGKPVNQARPVVEDDEMAHILRSLGHSIGVIALGRRIVLIEGERTSLDKQLYGSILGDSINKLVLVPVGGQETLATLARSLDAVLSKTLWGVDFFMLCDGDTTAGVRGSGTDLEAKSGGRLRLLPRYHVENYFLDETVLSECFQDQVGADHWLRDPRAIREKLRVYAKETLAYAVALRISHRVRMTVGNVEVMAKGASGKTVDELKAHVLGRVRSETTRIGQGLSEGAIEAGIDEEWKRLETALEADTDVWKFEIPARPILHKFAGAASLPPDRLKRLYISRAAARTGTDDPFQEIRKIFDGFVAGS